MTLSSTAVERAIAQCTVAGQWRGDTALTLPLFWRRSTVSPGLFRAVSAVEPITSVPFPTLSPSLIGHPASVDAKQHKRGRRERVSGSTARAPTPHSKHRFPAPSSKEGCRQPVLGVWLRPGRRRRPWTTTRTSTVLRQRGPRCYVATSVLRNCCFNCRAEQRGDGFV